MREFWRTPAGRGFIMLAVMSAAFGFAVNGHSNLRINYFEEVLHFSGPQFGYIAAIWETGGLVLILLTALLHRISLQKITAGALVVVAAGYALFSVAGSFATVIPWVLVTSFGLHVVTQTQVSLGLSLTTPAKSGAILGRMAAMQMAGTLAVLVLVFVIFRFGWLSYRPTFFIFGAAAFVGALAIVRFPHMQEGQLRKAAPTRDPIVWRRDYRLYYWLCAFDGARQQVIFSFGLWVLVNRFGMGVEQISLVLLAVTGASMMTMPRFGRAIDRFGERQVLTLANIAFVVTLAGYALSNNVIMACVFYCIYALLAPVAYIGGSTYLRRICAPQDLAPSLAMGITIAHAVAIVVPVLAGFVLNYVGYQIPFYAACGVTVIALFVTLRLDPAAQRCPARIAADEAAAGEQGALSEGGGAAA